MDLIARIQELLAQRGWSQYQLAKEADLSQLQLVSSAHFVFVPSDYLNVNHWEIIQLLYLPLFFF